MKQSFEDCKNIPIGICTSYIYVCVRMRVNMHIIVSYIDGMPYTIKISQLPSLFSIITIQKASDVFTFTMKTLSTMERKREFQCR